MSASRTALVTGATGGLGRAIAAQLAADGVDLVLAGRAEAPLLDLLDVLSAQWPERRVRLEVCDLAEEAAIRGVMARLEADHVVPDIVVNNAAVQGPIGPFHDAAWGAWVATIVVDLLAPALLTQLALPAMIARGWGRIVNVSGGGAAGARPDFSAYAVAKTGLVRLTETLAQELAGTGVTVNAVAPGPMNTRMLDEVLHAGPRSARTEYAAAVARAREGGVPPGQAARLIGWLASPESARITGRLVSAVWDPWTELDAHADAIERSDIYTLRRIVPKDRGQEWGNR